MTTQLLIINPQLAFTVALKQALERTGSFDVHPFTTPDAAFEYLQEHPQDVVLVHIAIPGVDGPGLIASLRRLQPDLPIVVSPQQPEAVLRRMAVQGAIDPPFSARDVIPLLQSALEARALIPRMSEPVGSEEEYVITTRFDDDDSGDYNTGGSASFEAVLDELDEEGSIFDFDLSQIEQPPSPEDTPSRSRSTRNFDDLVRSMRAEESRKPLHERTQSLIDFTLPDKDDLSRTRDTVESARMFRQLADEEPPMPGLEEGGTVSDLMSGVVDPGFRDVLAILRGDEQTPQSDNAPALSDDELQSVLDSFYDVDAGASAGGDFVDPFRSFDEEEEPGYEGRSTARVILETTFDEATPPDQFSIDQLISSIEQQLPEHRPNVRPLPSWRQDIQPLVAEPDFLPEEPSKVLPLDFMGDLSDQTTRPSSRQRIETRAGEMETEMYDAPPSRQRDEFDALFDAPPFDAGRDDAPVSTDEWATVFDEQPAEPASEFEDSEGLPLFPDEAATPDAALSNEEWGAVFSQETQSNVDLSKLDSEGLPRFPDEAVDWADFGAVTQRREYDPAELDSEALPRFPEQSAYDAAELDSEDLPRFPELTEDAEGDWPELDATLRNPAFEGEALDSEGLPRFPEFEDAEAEGAWDAVADAPPGLQPLEELPQDLDASVEPLLMEKFYGTIDDSSRIQPVEDADEAWDEDELAKLARLDAEQSAEVSPVYEHADSAVWQTVEAPEDEAALAWAEDGDMQADVWPEESEAAEVWPETETDAEAAAAFEAEEAPADRSPAWAAYMETLQEAPPPPPPVWMGQPLPELPTLQPEFDTALFDTAFNRLADFDFPDAEILQLQPNTGARPVDDPRIAQLALSLTHASLESAAEATMLTRRGEIVAFAGDLTRDDLNELQRAIAKWDDDIEQAHVGFVTLASNSRVVMVYTRPTEGGLALSMVFAGSTPLKDIRRQGKRLVEALESVPDPDTVLREMVPIVELPTPPPAPEPADVGPLVMQGVLWLLADPDAELDDELAQAIIAGLSMQLNEQRWRIEQVEVAEDYVYVLGHMPAERLQPELAADLKQRAAQIVHAVDASIDPTTLWAGGYMVVSPGRPLEPDEIREYVDFERM
jgi:CheY-like chemotaxis protein